MNFRLKREIMNILKPKADILASGLSTPAEEKIQHLIEDMEDRLVSYDKSSNKSIVETLFKARYMESQKFPSIRRYYQDSGQL